MSRFQRIFFENTFKISAVLTIVFLLLILFFILNSSLLAINDVGLIDMLISNEWQPSGKNPQFGLFNMVAATLFTTFWALFLGVPIGIGTAIFIVKIASKKVGAILLSIVEILAGIPSIIYGFFILKTVVEFIYQNNSSIEGVSGNSLLAAIIVLTIMVLPTIITITTTSLQQVDKSLRDASYALGANSIQTIFKIDLRAAKSGIFASILLGSGKVLGETMAVLLVCGNSPLFPGNPLFPIRTLTANIATEMGYASGLQQSALFATGVILFIMVIIINLIILRVNRKVGF